jgi:hypothetical protein
MAYLGCDSAFIAPASTLFFRGHTIMMRIIPRSTFSRRSALALASLASAVLGLPGAASAANLDDVVKAFEKNRDYVEPIATLFGSASNSGWYQSSSVPKGFSFYLGLPLNLTVLSDDDRSFKGTWTDGGCAQYHQNNPEGTQSCSEKTSYTAPTLFGRDKGPKRDSSAYNPNSNSITGTFHIPLNDGNPDASALNWIPFGEPQLGISFYHTELKLRYFALPLDIFSVSLPGVGLQHDLASFLPPLPVHLSVAANWTWLSGEWTPGENIDGSMELDGTSAFYGLLAGYTYANWLEVFAETGWETSSVEVGGSLVIHDPDKGKPGNIDEPDQTVKPRLTLEGRNGFRISLNLALHFGYDAVFGQNVGANLGNQVSIMAYRYKK